MATLAGVLGQPQTQFIVCTKNFLRINNFHEYVCKYNTYFVQNHQIPCMPNVHTLHQDQRELGNLLTFRPIVVVPKRSEGATKGLRISKSLSSRRSRRLTYLDCTEKESLVLRSCQVGNIETSKPLHSKNH